MKSLSAGLAGILLLGSSVPIFAADFTYEWQTTSDYLTGSGDYFTGEITLDSSGNTSGSAGDIVSVNFTLFWFGDTFTVTQLSDLLSFTTLDWNSTQITNMNLTWNADVPPDVFTPFTDSLIGLNSTQVFGGEWLAVPTANTPDNSNTLFLLMMGGGVIAVWQGVRARRAGISGGRMSQSGQRQG